MLICAKCYADMSPRAKKCADCGHVPSDADVFKTRYTADDLLKLGLSPTLVKFVMKPPRCAALEYSCEKKYGGWISSIPDDVTAVYPLWSSNGDLTVVWQRAGKREFVETHHDDDDFVLASTEQGLLASLFKQVMEGLDWDDAKETARSEKQFRKAASLMGFEHADEFLKLYMRSGEDPDGDEEQIAALIVSLGGPSED